MTTHHVFRLSSCVGAIALVMAASQAGATTYSVPLQFTLNLTAPVCSLTVGSATADVTTPVHATGVSVNLTPTPLSVLSTPVGLIASIPGTTAYTASAAGLFYNATGTPNARKLDSMPAASATCTVGTPMTATITRGAANTLFGSTMMAGQAGSGQSGNLPVGMMMGISAFDSVVGASNNAGNTYGSTSNASISTTASGSAQPLVLTATLAASQTTALTASYAGDWYYPFTVNLNF